MKKVAPIKETIEKELEKQEKGRRRMGLLRETALLKLRWVPNIRKALDFIAELLLAGAGAQPLDPKLLGESIIRAKLRAGGEELRHIQEWLGEVVDILRWQDSLKESALDPADRRLCEWAEEQRREVMRLAVRFERRVGPAPEARPEGPKSET